jgi:hypothetical protein
VHWNKRWTGREKFYTHLEKTGRVAPVDRRPHVLRWLWLYRAFRELSTCRVIGMSAGQIPISAVHAYVDRYELPEWSVDALLKIDVEWLALVNEDGN